MLQTVHLNMLPHTLQIFFPFITPACLCMLQEMAIQIDSLPVFYRQRDTLFYPAVTSYSPLSADSASAARSPGWGPSSDCPEAERCCQHMHSAAVLVRSDTMAGCNSKSRSCPIHLSLRKQQGCLTCS